MVGAVGGCQGPGVVYDPFRPGPHAVRTRTLQLTDGVRPAACELWSPDDGDGRPLVVFSHLSGGTRLSSAFLCRHLAGHGYAVAALDHTDVVARRVLEVRLVLTELLAGTGGLQSDGRLLVGAGDQSPSPTSSPRSPRGCARSGCVGARGA